MLNGDIPVPVSVAEVVKPGSPVTCKLADLAPTLVGAKRTRMMQGAPGASVPVHWLLSIVNSDGSAPTKAVLSAPEVTPPMLVTVKATEILLVVATTCSKS